MEKIFIVEETTGEYEDRFTRPVKAFRSEEDANAYCNEQQKYYDELSDKYTELTDPKSAFNADALNEKAYHAYLKDIAPDLSEQYEKLGCNANDKSFDWERYYSYEYSFFDLDTRKKYYKKIGMSEKDIENMEVIDEYNELFCGIPRYTVTRGIDLV